LELHFLYQRALNIPLGFGALESGLQEKQRVYIVTFWINWAAKLGRQSGDRTFKIAADANMYDMY
jgi:hypothetical protein